MGRQDTMNFLGLLMAAAPQAAAGSALGPILDHFSNMLGTPARAASLTSQSLPRLFKVSTWCMRTHLCHGAPAALCWGV